MLALRRPQRNDADSVMRRLMQIFYRPEARGEFFRAVDAPVLWDDGQCPMQRDRIHRRLRPSELGTLPKVISWHSGRAGRGNLKVNLSYSAPRNRVGWRGRVNQGTLSYPGQAG